MNAVELDRMKAEILSWLKREAWGHANAKPRRHLVKRLLFLAYHLPKADPDSFVRRTYRAMPEVGRCAQGIYLIVTAEDRRISAEYLHGKAMKILTYEKSTKDAAPCGQMSLPIGGER